MPRIFIGARLAWTNWSSAVIVTSFASARSPVGSGLFQLMPKSVRSTLAVTVIPSRCMPHGSAIGA